MPGWLRGLVGSGGASSPPPLSSQDTQQQQQQQHLQRADTQPDYLTGDFAEQHAPGGPAHAPMWTASLASDSPPQDALPTARPGRLVRFASGPTAASGGSKPMSPRFSAPAALKGAGGAKMAASASVTALPLLAGGLAAAGTEDSRDESEEGSGALSYSDEDEAYYFQREEEEEEAWYYGAEHRKRGWRHAENQLIAWVAALVVAAIALNIRLFVSDGYRHSQVDFYSIPLQPPPSPPPSPPPMPPPIPPSPQPPRPPGPPHPRPPSVTRPPPRAPLPQPPLLRPPPITRPPPTAPLQTLAPPATPRTGWSEWQGRETPQSTIGICPCTSHIDTWKVWYAQGLQASATDTSPITGLTGTCVGPAGVAAGVEVFPGQGPSAATLSYPPGWTNVTGLRGDFLDNWLGVGGTGPQSFAWLCLPGELVTGLHVAWEASSMSNPPINIATGVRVYCENPNTCGGGQVPTPTTSAPPPPAAKATPPPAAKAVPPPAAKLVPPAAKLAPPATKLVPPVRQPPPPRPPLVALAPPPLRPPASPPLLPKSPPPRSPPLLPPLPPPAAPTGGVAPAPPGVAPAPPIFPQTGWSQWQGRETPDSTIGICPCTSVINGLNIWVAQGLQVAADESSPLTGITANCLGPNNLEGGIDVFPGQGFATQSVSQDGGWTNITGLRGSYLDNLLGVGGTGPQAFAWLCLPGELVTGLHVAWETSAQVNPPIKIAAGLRVYCENPNTCNGGGGGGGTPGGGQPPPAAATPGFVSPWLGAGQGPATSGGLCPCGTYVSSFSIWLDGSFVGSAGALGALTGLTAECSGNGPIINALPGPGAASNVIVNENGFNSMYGQYGAYLANLNGIGGSAPMTFSYLCPQYVAGFEVDARQAGAATYIAGVRFYCGKGPACDVPGAAVPPSAAPVASPPPPPPVVLPPPPVQAAAPPPPDTGLPQGIYSPWLGSGLGPVDYGGFCTCGTYIRSFNLWSDNAFTGPEGEVGAFYGVTATCSGPDQLAVEAFPGLGPPTNSMLSADGFPAVRGLYGVYVANLNGVGGTGPRPFNFTCPSNLRISGLILDTEFASNGREYVVGMQFICGDSVECGGAPSPPPPALPPGAWAQWLGSNPDPTTDLLAREVEGVCACGSYIKNWNFFINGNYTAGPESGRLYGITSDCSDGKALDVFPGGSDAPTQSWLGVEGFTGMTVSYGTWINNLGGLGGSGPQSTSYYCPAGQLILGYSVAIKEDKGNDFATGIRFYCGTPSIQQC